MAWCSRSLREAEHPVPTTHIRSGPPAAGWVTMTVAGAPWYRATSTSNTRSPAAIRLTHPARAAAEMPAAARPPDASAGLWAGLVAFGPATGAFWPCLASCAATWLLRFPGV